MPAWPEAALPSRSRRIARVSAGLAAGLLLACAGSLVVRAPQDPQPHPASVLGQIAPLAIAVPPAGGAAATADPLGERAGGWGRPSGSIAMTERPGDLVRRVVIQELEQAGHRVVAENADVHVGIEVREFSVDAPRAGRGWDVTVAMRVALRVSRSPGADDWSEFVYGAESVAHTPAPPGVSMVERVLAQAVRQLGSLLAERQALAAALERIGGPAG